MADNAGAVRARLDAAAPVAVGVTITWAIVIISCVLQKSHADKTIADAFDISAVQIQQLNGSVTSHVLVAVAIGLGITMIAGFWLLAAPSRSAVAGFELLDELRSQSRAAGIPTVSSSTLPPPSDGALPGPAPAPPGDAW